MDKTTAFKEMLKATEASIEALKAMLPDDAWQDNPDGFQRAARECLQRALYEIRCVDIVV